MKTSSPPMAGQMPVVAHESEPAPAPGHAKPPLLVAFGGVFLFAPIVNYAVRANVRGLALGDAFAVMHAFGPAGGALLVGSCLVGVGLLAVNRWGLRLFCAYAPSLIAYDLYELAHHPTAFNGGALAQTFFAFAAIAYFLRKDIRAPYLSETERGFRGRKRYPVSTDVVVDGTTRTTRDFSREGCFINWPGCDREIGATLEMRASVLGQAFGMTGKIVRKDEHGVGIAFELDERQPESLREALSQHIRVGKTNPRPGA